MTRTKQRTIGCLQGVPVAGVIAGFALWAACLPVHAQEAMLRANNQVWVDAGAQQLRYHEDINANQGDSERGTTAAFALGASTQREVFGISNLYFSGAVRVTHGNVNYRGYLQDGVGNVVTPGYQMTTRSTATDVTLKAGKAFPFLLGSWHAQLVPYATYGYHEWIRDSSRDTYGFYERYRHHVVGAGVLGQLEVTPKLVASADFRAGAVVGGSMTLAGSSNTFTLGSKPTMVATIGLDYAIARNFHVNASYEWSKFQYGRSDTTQINSTTYGYEPDSKTINQTWMVGLGYAF